MSRVDEGKRGGGEQVGEMTPLELSQRLEQEQPVVLLDVREPHEREIADLPESGQFRIPLGELPDRLDELDPEVHLVVYCRSGARSGQAAEFLSAHGFERVYNLVGGLLRWREDVDPSVKAY